jgi:bacterioferritin (cytochrome b1)
LQTFSHETLANTRRLAVQQVLIEAKLDKRLMFTPLVQKLKKQSIEHMHHCLLRATFRA